MIHVVGVTVIIIHVLVLCVLRQMRSNNRFSEELSRLYCIGHLKVKLSDIRSRTALMLTTFVAYKRFKTVYRLNRTQKLGEGRLKSCKLNLNGILFLNSFAFITKTKIYFLRFCCICVEWTCTAFLQKDILQIVLNKKNSKR